MRKAKAQLLEVKHYAQRYKENGPTEQTLFLIKRAGYRYRLAVKAGPDSR